MLTYCSIDKNSFWISLSIDSFLYFRISILSFNALIKSWSFNYLIKFWHLTISYSITVIDCMFSGSWYFSYISKISSFDNYFEWLTFFSSSYFLTGIWLSYSILISGFSSNKSSSSYCFSLDSLSFTIASALFPFWASVLA